MAGFYLLFSRALLTSTAFWFDVFIKVFFAVVIVEFLSYCDSALSIYKDSSSDNIYFTVGPT